MRMDSPQTPYKIESQPDVPQSYYELMNAMQRVYNIGLYYPIGHTMADQAIGHFLSAVKKNADKKSGCLHFGVKEHALSLQKNELNTKLPAVKTFYDMFSALHITSIDIHRDIKADEARLFFGEIISQNTKIRACRDFSKMIITELPETVKIRQINFVSGDAVDTGGESKDTSRPTLEYLLSSLMERGIPEEMLSICRQLLESVQDTLEKRQLDNSALTSVTWEDVERLLFGLAEFIQSSHKDGSEKPLEERYNIDALIAILTALDDPNADAQSKQAVKKAVNLLIDVTKGPVPETQEDAPQSDKSLRPRDRVDISIGELKQEILTLERHHIAVPLFQNTRSEQLSVLMVMLRTPLHVRALLNIQRAFLDCFITALATNEWQILLQGTWQLFKALDRERLHFILVIFLQAFRFSPHTSSLMFIRDICRQLTDDELVTFWPFLVNELLVEGTEKEPGIFLELCTVAGSLSEQNMRAAIPCLKILDALAERKIAANIFLSHPPALHFFFILMLESSQGGYFCKKIINGLREHPFGWLDQAVSPLLESDSEEDQRFIVNLFQQDDPANPDAALKREGATIIVERLQILPLEQRKEPWVAESIVALSRVRLLGAYSFLIEIGRDKQFLLIAKWPKLARIAALKALKNY
ncbi:hypothetical protein GMJAKD_08245 [Candidatus Electrothrix aarhusensis]